jgi:hypothetical protein
MLLGTGCIRKIKDKLIQTTGDCEILRGIIPVFVLPRSPLLFFSPYYFASMLALLPGCARCDGWYHDRNPP